MVGFRWDSKKKILYEKKARQKQFGIHWFNVCWVVTGLRNCCFVLDQFFLAERCNGHCVTGHWYSLIHCYSEWKKLPWTFSSFLMHLLFVVTKLMRLRLQRYAWIMYRKPWAIDWAWIFIKLFALWEVMHIQTKAPSRPCLPTCLSMVYGNKRQNNWR